MRNKLKQKESKNILNFYEFFLSLFVSLKTSAPSVVAFVTPVVTPVATRFWRKTGKNQPDNRGELFETPVLFCKQNFHRLKHFVVGTRLKRALKTKSEFRLSLLSGGPGPGPEGDLDRC